MDEKSIYANFENPEHIWSIEEVERLVEIEDVHGQSWRIKATDGKGRVEVIDTPEWYEGSRRYHIGNFTKRVGDVLLCYPTQNEDKDTLDFLAPGFYTVSGTSGEGAIRLEGQNGWITDGQVLGRVFFQCESETVMKGTGQYVRCELEKHDADEDHQITIIHKWK